MKKTILLFVFAIVSIANFSCSSDDDNNGNNNQIVDDIYTINISTNALEGFDSHIILTYYFEDGTEDYFFEDNTSVNLTLPENLIKFNIVLAFGGNPGFNIRLYKNTELIEEINNTTDYSLNYTYEF